MTRNIAAQGLALCAAAMLAAGCAATRADAETDIVAEFAAAHAETGPAAQPLSYREFLTGLEDAETLAARGRAFSVWRERLDAVDDRALSVCGRIDLAKAREAARRSEERARLGFLWRTVMRTAERTNEPGEGGVHAEPGGPAIYRHILSAWLGEDVHPDAIYAFGLEQTAAARARLQSVRGADDAQALIADPGEVQALFAAVQETVRANIESVFLSDYGTPPAKIVQSDQGESFPVPGYYNPDEGAFYFNILGDGFAPRETDWLFLHEGTPGHHFQFRIMSDHGACPGLAMADLRYPAYFEGWAAYVETLGAQLGLYTDDAALASAYEWDLIRSARVALDVGIGFYGWTDDEAHDFWRQQVGMREDLAAREIARMRRWPGQVVTYKYGAAKIAALRAKLEADIGDGFDIRAFHDAVLRYSDMPLGAFDDIIEEAVRRAPRE